MNCPTCKDVQLLMSERQQIEIDYCPNCRGIWLDRGELDKLIERANTVENSHSKAQYSHYETKNDFKKHDHNTYHKKKSWLSDLFD